MKAVLGLGAPLQAVEAMHWNNALSRWLGKVDTC